MAIMSDHSGTTLAVVARKRHSCAWCGGTITKGMIYDKQFIVSEGDPWTKKMHRECTKAQATYDFEGDTLYYSGQFERGHNHEPNWSTVEQGVKIGCPGCIEAFTKAKS